MKILEDEFFKILGLNKEEREFFEETFEIILDFNFQEITETNFDQIKNSTMNFIEKIIQFMQKTKDFSIGLFLFIILLMRFIFIYAYAGTLTIIKTFIFDLFNLKTSLSKFDEKILTSKIADPTVKEFIKINFGFTVNDVIKKCWDKVYSKYEKKLRTSNFEIIDSINKWLHKAYNKRAFYSSLNNPIFYNLYKHSALLKNKDFIDFSHEVNLCVLTKLKDFVVSLAISLFEIGEVSEKLVRNLTAKNDILRVASNFKQLYQTSSQNLNRTEKLFIESILVLMDLKLMIDKILSKKENLSYSIITKYETLNKSINFSLKEIEEAFRRTKDFKDQKINKYEENLRQNRDRRLNGNEPTQPKKESLFDI